MREEPDAFIKKLMAGQSSRQERASRHLGPDGRFMCERLDSFFWKAIIVIGKCLREEHHPLATRLLLGRFDDLVSLDSLPGGAISASLEEIQASCERRVRLQEEEIRRSCQDPDDARDVSTVIEVVMDLALHAARLAPSRTLFASLAREQIKDMLAILGSDIPGSGILDLPRTMN